jgi:hypothetical protein
VDRNLLDLHRNTPTLHPEKGAEEGSALRIDVGSVVFREGLELAHEGRPGKGRDVIGQHAVPLDPTFPDLGAGVYRDDVGAFGLIPEGFRRKPFLDPDAEQGVPIPPYPALGGFAFFAPKKPSMSFDSTFRAAS